MLIIDHRGRIDGALRAFTWTAVQACKT